MLRQPINPTLIVSLGGVAREEESAMEDRGAAIPAVRAAEDLIKVLLLMFMMSKKIQVNKVTKIIHYVFQTSRMKGKKQNDVAFFLHSCFFVTFAPRKRWRDSSAG
jgi:hypothetical protein